MSIIRSLKSSYYFKQTIIYVHIFLLNSTLAFVQLTIPWKINNNYLNQSSNDTLSTHFSLLTYPSPDPFNSSHKISNSPLPVYLSTRISTFSPSQSPLSLYHESPSQNSDHSLRTLWKTMTSSLNLIPTLLCWNSTFDHDLFDKNDSPTGLATLLQWIESKCDWFITITWCIVRWWLSHNYFSRNNSWDFSLPFRFLQSKLAQAFLMYPHGLKVRFANDTKQLDLYPNIWCSIFLCKLAMIDQTSNFFHRTNNPHSGISVKCSLVWTLFCFGTMNICLSPLSKLWFVIKWQTWRFPTWSLLCIGWKLRV